MLLNFLLGSLFSTLHLSSCILTLIFPVSFLCTLYGKVLLNKFLDLPIMTTANGEYPTKDNSTPLYFCGHDSHGEDNAWKRADGRGSMVWFNQASMIQTSELGVSTLKLARQLGMKTECDAKAWMEKNVFTKHSIWASLV